MKNGFNKIIIVAIEKAKPKYLLFFNQTVYFTYHKRLFSFFYCDFFAYISVFLRKQIKNLMQRFQILVCFILNSNNLRKQNMLETKQFKYDVILIRLYSQLVEYEILSLN